MAAIEALYEIREIVNERKDNRLHHRRNEPIVYTGAKSVALYSLGPVGNAIQYGMLLRDDEVDAHQFGNCVRRGSAVSLFAGCVASGLVVDPTSLVVCAGYSVVSGQLYGGMAERVVRMAHIKQ